MQAPGELRRSADLWAAGQGAHDNNALSYIYYSITMITMQVSGELCRGADLWAAGQGAHYRGRARHRPLAADAIRHREHDAGLSGAMYTNKQQVHCLLQADAQL